MQHRHLRVLAVDDNPDHAALLRLQLESIQETTFSMEHVYDGDSCLRALGDTQIDVIFLDYRLGNGESGLDILKCIRDGGDTRGIIVTTSSSSVPLAVQLTQAGADDYIEKGTMTVESLRRAIGQALAQSRRREALEENCHLFAELKAANTLLERKNARLAELYNTAHQFVDNVSHEFRTPLAVIKEYASLIHDGVLGDVNEEQIEFLDVIGNRVEDLALMVDDMLEISRFGAGLMRAKRQACLLSEIINHIKPNLDRRASINRVKLEIKIPSTLPEVYCDPEKVGRTIINLAVNGLKFAPQGGHVCIDAKFIPQSAEVMITISDNGPGISEENQRLIFDRFKQVHGEVRQSTKGFGLGLNIARELVHVNLGRIELQSQLGHGSTFSFTIPVAEPAKVLQKYLDWVLILDEQVDVAVIWCGLDGSIEGGVGNPEVDDFVRSNVRPRDLVFCVATGVWLLIAQCDSRESVDMIERLQEVRVEANRNRPTDAIPNLQYTTIGTWRVPSERAALTERFGELYHQGVECVA